VLTWNLGIGPVEFEEQMADEFNASHPGINLAYEDITAGLGMTDWIEKLRVSLENQTGPDIMGEVDTGANLNALVATGEVMDLTDLYAERGWNEILPQSLIDSVTVDGRIYAIPQIVDSVGMFYNQDIFNQLGLSIPTTYEEYLQLQQTLKDNGYYGFTMGLAGGWPAALMTSQYIYSSAGSEYIKVLTGDEAWTDCAACLAGLNAFQQNVTDNFANPDVLGIDQTQADDLFFQGKSAMVLSGSWFLGEINSAAPDFQVGFFYMPPVNPDTDISVLGGVGGALIIAKYAPPETLQVLDWLLSPETLQESLRNGGSTPTFPVTVPEDLDPLAYQRATQTQQIIDSVGFWPVNYLAPQVFSQMNQFVQGMVGGQLTPEQLLQKMQDAQTTYAAATGG
jgi:raffinose/stachyose/melibiose transport system substrate-binding protein